MRAHTNDFKNCIKKFGRELDVKISYTLNDQYITLSSSLLNSVVPIINGDILKSVMKQIDIDSNIQLPLETIINVQAGIKVNSIYEYINYGNYVVYKVEYNADTMSYNHICYDKMLYSMKDYETLDITYPITIRDYISAICTKLGLLFVNADSIFANYNKEIQNELYLDNNGNSLGYTFRDVFDELAQVTASTICINDNDELEIRYINDTNDIIDEHFIKDVNVTIGKKYGPINSIVLSRSAESDNIYLKDDESIEENGLCEIKIVDNQIMNFNDRSDYLDDILEKLNGLEYYTNDFESTGVCYYEICDRYTISLNNTNYTCILLNNEIQFNQGIIEKIYTQSPNTSITDYKKADKTDRKINKAYIIVDKQNKKIDAVVETQDEQSDKISQLTIESDEIKTTVQSQTQQIDANDTNIKNNYQEIINKFGDYAPNSSVLSLEQSVSTLQTDTYSKTEINKIITGTSEDGTAVTKVLTTSGTFDENGMHYEKSGSKTSSTINEKGLIVNGTTSNEELLFAGYDEELQQTIVRTENLTVRRYLVVGNNSRIEDYNDGGGIFIL